MRHSDKPCIEVETRVAAPAESIWPLVTDPGVLVRSSGELVAARWADGEPAAVGSTYVGTNRNRYFGEWQTTSTVIESRRPESFAWAVGDVDDPNTTWRFLIRPDGATTVLTQWMQLGTGPSGLGIAIARQPDKEDRIVASRLEEFRTAMTANLAEIKRLAEEAG